MRPTEVSRAAQDKVPLKFCSVSTHMCMYVLETIDDEGNFRKFLRQPVQEFRSGASRDGNPS